MGNVRSLVLELPVPKVSFVVQVLASGILVRELPVNRVKLARTVNVQRILVPRLNVALVSTAKVVNVLMTLALSHAVRLVRSVVCRVETVMVQVKTRTMVRELSANLLDLRFPPFQDLAQMPDKPMHRSFLKIRTAEIQLETKQPPDDPVEKGPVFVMSKVLQLLHRSFGLEWLHFFFLDSVADDIPKGVGVKKC